MSGNEESRDSCPTPVPVPPEGREMKAAGGTAAE